MEGVTKEQRTKIHDAVKKAFGDTIVGSTVNIGDKKFMRFEKYRKGGKRVLLLYVVSSYVGSSTIIVGR